MPEPDNMATHPVGELNITGLGSIVVYRDDTKPDSIFIATQHEERGHDGKLTGDDKYHIRYSRYGVYGFMGKFRQHLEGRGFTVERIDTRTNFKPEIFEIRNTTAMNVQDFGKTLLSEAESFKKVGFHSSARSH